MMYFESLFRSTEIRLGIMFVGKHGAWPIHGWYVGNWVTVETPKLTNILPMILAT
jgi:hypothetical protein